MVYHIPQQIRQHGNLLQFSGQGIQIHKQQLWEYLLDEARVYLPEHFRTAIYCVPPGRSPGVPPGALPDSYILYSGCIVNKCYFSCTLFFIIGVEKNNDDAKHDFYSSNRHDPCGEVLRTEKRLEHLHCSCRGEKPPYCKHNQQYWGGDISEERAEKPRWSFFFF